MPQNRFPKSHHAFSAMTESTQWWCIILLQGFYAETYSVNVLVIHYPLPNNYLMVSGLFPIKLTTSGCVFSVSLTLESQFVFMWIDWHQVSSFLTWTSVASIIKPSFRFGDILSSCLLDFLLWVWCTDQLLAAIFVFTLTYHTWSLQKFENCRFFFFWHLLLVNQSVICLWLQSLLTA